MEKQLHWHGIRPIDCRHWPRLRFTDKRKQVILKTRKGGSLLQSLLPAPLHVRILHCIPFRRKKCGNPDKKCRNAAFLL